MIEVPTRLELGSEVRCKCDLVRRHEMMGDDLPIPFGDSNLLANYTFHLISNPRCSGENEHGLLSGWFPFETWTVSFPSSNGHMAYLTT